MERNGMERNGTEQDQLWWEVIVIFYTMYKIIIIIITIIGFRQILNTVTT